jgi:hypothetical protein
MVSEKLYIKPTKRSPLVLFEPGRLLILGRSIIENPSVFYDSALKFIADPDRSWQENTKIIFGYEYINTGSTKWLYLILRQLAEIKNLATIVTITWYYEEGDNDMFELGNMLKPLVECNFDIVELPELNETTFGSLLSGSR